MKKFVLGTLTVLTAMSLSAAVIATVNGQDVTDEDVGILLRQVPGAQYENLPAETQQQVLNQAIDRKLLTVYAVNSGVEKDGEYITALNKIKNEIALEVWMKKEFDKVKVTDAAIKKFYGENGDKFLQPEQIKASHILVADENEAKAIIKELSSASSKDLAAKFAASAKEKSTDGSAQNGGDLGWFSKGQMVKPFNDAAFALKKGEFTKTPVKTQFGYHVIYIEDKKAERKAALDEVKEQITGALKGEEFRKNVEAQAKILRDKAKVDIKK
ncbi:MAG: peptidylprolyl isomerase [Campylobacteraceae bacterium]|jgi:parvulin-like peptidyl-prolyl isomerase|nr:peptidylprolyl isomerase [Campylobacteraceae bacterium]